MGFFGDIYGSKVGKTTALGGAMSLFGGGGGDEEVSPPTLLEMAQQFGPAAQEFFETTQSIAPQQAQLQLDLLRQFGLPIAQEQQRQFAELSPFQAQLPEALAEQALEQSQAGLTPNEQRILTDAIRANLGEQAVSGLGTQRLGADLIQATQARQQQGRQLGLALSGRTPVFQGVVPQFTQFEAGFSPGQAIQAQQTAFSQLPVDEGNAALFSGLGQLAGMGAGMFFGGPMGAAVGGQAGSQLGQLFA